MNKEPNINWERTAIEQLKYGTRLREDLKKFLPLLPEEYRKEFANLISPMIHVSDSIVDERGHTVIKYDGVGNITYHTLNGVDQLNKS